MKFTVLGSSGFIGGHMARHLKSEGHDVFTPARGDDLKGIPLGYVINAVGVVGNAKDVQNEMIEAHVTFTQRLLRDTEFTSFLYISSTRLYGAVKADTVTESIPLPLAAANYSVFDISKLLGECMCLSLENPAIRVARLSNVYGRGMSRETLLGALTRDIKEERRTTIIESPQSSKDYISVNDAVIMMEKIAVSGKERLYNVASGRITTHQQLADKLGEFGTVSFSGTGPTRVFPHIDTTRITSEFHVPCSNVVDDIPALF